MMGITSSGIGIAGAALPSFEPTFVEPSTSNAVLRGISLSPGMTSTSTRALSLAQVAQEQSNTHQAKDPWMSSITLMRSLICFAVMVGRFPSSVGLRHHQFLGWILTGGT